MDRKELKIQALRERIAEITTMYEDKVADLRVEITFNAEAIREKDELIKALSTPDETVPYDTNPEAE